MLAGMSPRGVGAASRRTGARQLTASVFILGGLLGSACSIEQPVSGPVSLTGEWKTVDPPKPLRVGNKAQQEVCLQVVGTMSNVDFEKGRVLVNGQWHVLEGEVVDDEQTKHGLRVGWAVIPSAYTAPENLIRGLTSRQMGRSSDSVFDATPRSRLGKSGGILTIRSRGVETYANHRFSSTPRRYHRQHDGCYRFCCDSRGHRVFGESFHDLHWRL
jgi:hypothetical protein